MKIKNLIAGWQLTVVPEKDVARYQNHLPERIYQPVTATVPGCVELDLYSDGQFPDPYFAQNPYEYRILEDKHFFYEVSFRAEEGFDRIHFEGIDTVADIYLNSEWIGHTENMFLEYDFPVSLKKGLNHLTVHIYPSVLVARKYDVPAYCAAQKFNYESLHIRKVASMYGWDIMPRFVSGGIFKPVWLYQKKKARLKDVGLFTSSITNENSQAFLKLKWNFETDDPLLEGYQIRLEGVCGDSRFCAEEPALFTTGYLNVTVDCPKLWYPRNCGAQSLYHMTVTLLKNGKELDRESFDFGIRTVELDRTSTTTQDGDGEFCFKVNGKKIFVLGTNWVPLDAFPCRYDERMFRALEELYDIGCNAVRVWGGGSYQPQAFYDFCDRKGILVWQDFCMGCAVYPNDEDFVGAIREEALFVVKKLRNHPSIVLWAGDNECDEMLAWNHPNLNPNDNILTRKVLAEVVRNEDFKRPYLPSSPYTDEEAYRSGRPIPEQHLWGPRDYFKGDYYRNNPCHFASEIGYHGCPSPQSLKKFISGEQLYPFMSTDGSVNEDWICHASGVVKGMSGPYAYRIPLMKKQVCTMFADSVPDNLDDFAKASQISQAEADKFFIEHFRIAKWRKTGIIWWNLLDGWPQISDAVIDWYHTKKLAYHFIRRAQNPLQLFFGEAENGFYTLFADNLHDRDVFLEYKVEDITHHRTVLKGTATARANQSVPIERLQTDQTYCFLLMTAKTDNGEIKTHFITQSRNLSYSQYLSDLTSAGMDEFEGF